MPPNPKCSSVRQVSRLLGVMVVLQGLILLGQWTGGSAPGLPRAEAQIVDPGAQRIQIIDELKKVNDKLDRLVSLLESGKLQVAAPDAEEKR
jgi:hypothetical protein